MREPLVHELHGRGWHFYKFIEPDIYRVMCSWSVGRQDIDDFVADVKELATLYTPTRSASKHPRAGDRSYEASDGATNNNWPSRIWRGLLEKKVLLYEHADEVCG